MSEIAAPPHTHLGKILQTYLRIDSSRIYLYSILVGILSGVGAALLTYGLELVQFFYEKTQQNISQKMIPFI